MIEINGCYFDEKQYIREVVWLKYDTKRRIIDLLDKEFVIVEDFEDSQTSFNMKLYNKRLNIILRFEFTKYINEKTFFP